MIFFETLPGWLSNSSARHNLAQETETEVPHMRVFVLSVVLGRASKFIMKWLLSVGFKLATNTRETRDGSERCTGRVCCLGLRQLPPHVGRSIMDTACARYTAWNGK